MAKKTYSFEYEGKTFTRTTARTYSHVLLLTEGRNGGPSPLTWIGRPDLVDGQVRTWSGPTGFPADKLKVIALVEPEPK